MSVLSFAQLRQLAADTGFPDPSFAATIALRESSGNTNATNIHGPLPNALPERSFGLWQINTLAHPQYDESSLLDPDYNAHAALQISSGGTNWKPWSTYQDILARSFPWGAAIAGAVIVGMGAGAAYALSRKRRR
jgi:hypothetical protein